MATALSLFLIFSACLVPGSGMAATPARVLIYSATAEFRHDSIPTAIDALKRNGASANVNFDATEDQTLFTDEALSAYDALLFLSNTGEGG